MKKALVLSALGVALLLAHADTGYGQKKKKPAMEEANKATPEEYKLLQKVKELEGKLGSADGSAGKIYIQLNVPSTSGGKVNYVPKEFEFKFAEKLSVRKMALGIEYDNEGNVITRTSADIAKLRDPKLPGYAAKTDDLKSGQYVHLFLSPGKVDKDAKPDDKEGVGNVIRPVVRVVVILKDAESKVSMTPRKKKK